MNANEPFITIVLADHVPLKEGLRLALLLAMTHIMPPRRPYSIKRRIKTWCPRSVIHEPKLADHIPLKEGLRRSFAFSLGSLCSLADHIPLKEGLRHTQGLYTAALQYSQTMFH